ncbi:MULTISPECIES: MerR family transcriptional regulator [Streptomyces]|uniref:MerR family transcriptional regulator n=1 Tax=Streptomyces TaxID=1883 RepID=UPI0004C057F8|nr:MULTISPECIES: MerR family transcriptional regulator [Streptomyces]
MNGDATYTIGELARRTGLTVKTVRFYSDQGIVSPAGRNPVGHRRYGADAVARLELVRTLRELGLGLPAIRGVLERELALPAVAAAHAEALDVQIRVLRLRRAVLGAVARRGSTPEELTFVHQLARLSEDERGRLIGEFLAGVFGGLGVGGGVGVGGGSCGGGGGRFAAAARSLTPELPEDPSVEQVEAWVELAQLAGDDGFRALLRGLAEAEAAEAVEAAGAGAGGLPHPGLGVAVRELAGPAVAAGVDPGSEAAAVVVAELLERYAGMVPGGADGVVPARLGERLGERLAGMADPRRERYLELLAVVNGWAAPESWAAEVGWALRAVA